jgi:hypothetical protein
MTVLILVIAIVLLITIGVIALHIYNHWHYWKEFGWRKRDR